jgi:hypothetical protein
MVCKTHYQQQRFQVECEFFNSLLVRMTLALAVYKHRAHDWHTRDGDVKNSARFMERTFDAHGFYPFKAWSSGALKNPGMGSAHAGVDFDGNAIFYCSTRKNILGTFGDTMLV